MPAQVDRRRFRRAQLEVPVSLRSCESGKPDAKGVIAQAKDISLAGVYCTVQAPCALTAGEQVLCSIVIPPEMARLFPFTRLMGKGHVIRVEPFNRIRRAGDGESAEEPRVGVVVAFAPNITALASIES